MPYKDPQKAREWDRSRKRSRSEYLREYEKTRVRTRRTGPDKRFGLRTHCRNGHPFTPDNTYSRPGGERECRTCKRVGRRQSDTKRRALLAGVYVESVNPYVVFQRDGGICGICAMPVDPLDFHVDHVVPIARGGPHSYANCQLAHPLCNLRKGVS